MAKVLICCAVALGILLFLIPCVVYYCRDKNEITKHAHTEWSREFRKVGLDEVPEHAKYAGGAWIDGNNGLWTFRVDVPAMHQWLSRSQSLRTAKVTTKPGKKAYLFYAPAAHRACLVMVFMGDDEAEAQVNTIDIGAKKSHSTGRTRAVKDSLENLAYLRDNTGRWRID